jgi:hypothetical protein
MRNLLLKRRDSGWPVSRRSDEMIDLIGDGSVSPAASADLSQILHPRAGQRKLALNFPVSTLGCSLVLVAFRA